MSASDEGKLDPAVVAALYVEHGAELRRFLVGLLRDSQLADDALQAAFAKMVERGHQAQAESRKAWLFRVAYHEALAVRRREAVGSKVVQRAAWNRKHDHEAADEPLVRSEGIERVRAALDKLPAAQQQIVRMRIYEEKTFAVIAAELHIPLGTALARMRAALAKLRISLDEL